MSCEACGRMVICVPIEGAQICEACAQNFRSALDAARRNGAAWGRARDAHFVAREMLRHSVGTTQLLMRDVPKPVMQALKQRALDDETTVRELVLAAVEEYLKKRGNKMDGYVKNLSGSEINFEAAVQHMDDDIREQLHREADGWGDQQFFTEYECRHLEKFGEIWWLSEQNPQI